jgi:hypothetical protein
MDLALVVCGGTAVAAALLVACFLPNPRAGVGTGPVPVAPGAAPGTASDTASDAASDVAPVAVPEADARQ